MGRDIHLNRAGRVRAPRTRRKQYRYLIQVALKNYLVLTRYVRRYTQVCPKAVIPAGMPVSSAMDGNLAVPQVLEQQEVSPPCVWVPA